MELDAQDLKRGLKFIVGTWQVDNVVNAWSNDLAHIPAAEFKSTDGNDLSVISYTFFEDHTMVMKNAADGKEVQGTWEQTGWGEFHYTLNDFLNLQDSSFLKNAETLSMRDGEWLVFSLGFFAVAMKKTEEGTVTEEPDIGDIEMTDEEAEVTDIAGLYEVAKTMAVVGGEFDLFSKEEVAAELDRKKAAGEIDDSSYAMSMQGFGICVEFTKSHQVVQWMPVPAGVTEEQINAALESGQILDFNGEAIAMSKKPWKYLNGKYWYDTGEQRELFGEKQSSWDELKFDEEGLLEFGGMMKLRKKTE